MGGRRGSLFVKKGKKKTKRIKPDFSKMKKAIEDRDLLKKK